MKKYQVYDYENVQMHIAEQKCTYENDDDEPDYDMKLEIGELFMVDGWTYIDNNGNGHELNHYELKIVAIQNDKVICEVIDEYGDLKREIEEYQQESMEVN